MKSVYEFTKILSVLFLLSSIGFIFSELHLLAVIGIAAFVVIRIIDSDWMYNTMQLENHNSFVVAISFIVLGVYGYFIFQEMKYAPLMTHVKPEHNILYSEYEESLKKAFEPCETAHNKMIQITKTGVELNEKDIKVVKRTCYDAAGAIDKIVLPADKFSKGLSGAILKNKSELKKIALNLSAYNYAPGNVQDGVIRRVNASVDLINKNNLKIKQTLDPKYVEDVTEEFYIDFN